MRTLLSFAALMLFNFSVMSQSFPVLPIRFCQYGNAYHRINPSIVNFEYKASAYSGIQTNNIAFNTIYTYYTDLQLVLNSSSLINHAIGFNITGDHEGDLLRHTGVYFSYAVEVPLTDNLRFGSGISFGIMNDLILATPVSGGGSDMQPDGNLGVVLHSDRWHLGLALGQIFNSELQPIEERRQLVRHVNLTTEGIFDLSPSLRIKPGIWVRWYDQDLKDINLSLLSVISNKIETGSIVNYQKEIAFIFGLKELEFNRSLLNFSFSYGLTAGKNHLSAKQTYELTLQYHLRKKDDEVTF